MDMLRRNVFWIVCGVVAAAGVGLAVTGLRAMPTVKAEMEGAASVYRSLDGLQSQPLNEQAIEAQRERIEEIQADYEKVKERAFAISQYVPLLAGGVSQDEFRKTCLADPAIQREFPVDEAKQRSACDQKWFDKIALPEGTPLQRIEFRKAYTQAMNDLYSRLRCGGLPGPTMIKTMQDRRANELASGSTATAAGEARTPAGVLTAAGLRDDAASRAAIANARSFFNYCTPLAEEKSDYVPSLQFLAAMRETETVEAPEPFDVWLAQVGYWIQKDVVDAIVAVNELAVQEARAAGLDPWVGTMAVKDVISIRLGTQFYVPQEGGLFLVAKPGDYSVAVPPGSGESVFTGSRSNAQYDVIQFTVKLVMDQRDIPLLAEKLTNNRFHTLLRVSYVAVPPNRELKGRIYGPEPAVNVVLDFETAMLGEVFRPMMPQAVCEQFAIPCPPRPQPNDQG